MLVYIANPVLKCKTNTTQRLRDPFHLTSYMYMDLFRPAFVICLHKSTGYNVYPCSDMCHIVTKLLLKVEHGPIDDSNQPGYPPGLTSVSTSHKMDNS